MNSKPRETDSKVRIHLSFYDRVKFILLFTVVFLVLVWADMAGDPELSFNSALTSNAHRRWWVFLLFAIEFIRQTHFLIAELAAPYHGIWQRYFVFVDRQIRRLSDWTRFRISRVIKTILVVSLLSIVLGAIYKETPVKALFLAPKA